MSIDSFEDLKRHVGHEINCVLYGKDNVSVECETCYEILFDISKEDDYQKAFEEIRDAYIEMQASDSEYPMDGFLRICDKLLR
jgi:hypothetical protein